MTAVTDTEITPEQQAALEVGRQLVRWGIPVFLAYPDPAAKTGFRPAKRWEQTKVGDETAIDRWHPGLALCAVMGRGLDLVDLDPRDGGTYAALQAALDGNVPHIYAAASTPSGGQHLFIASLWCGSRDATWPGIDIKSGMPDGTGRGFAFIAPTIRASKVDGQLRSYRWDFHPEGTWLGQADDSGARIGDYITHLRSQTSAMTRGHGGPAWWQEFMAQKEPQPAAAAERAINDKLADVRAFDPASGTGFRKALLTAALTLGGYVGAGYIDEGDARIRLAEAVAAYWGNPPNDEDELWIQQGLDDGNVRPFAVYTPEDELFYSEEAQARAGEGEDAPLPAGVPPVIDDSPPWNIFTALSERGPFDPDGDSTDQGQAKAVAARMYPVLRYASDTGQWVKRRQYVWEATSDNLSRWIVAVLAELMPLGSTPVPKELSERTEMHWQAVRRALFMSSAGSGKISAKLQDMVRFDHPATLEIGELDSNPEILWAGGIPWNLAASGDVPTPADWVDPNTPHLHTASVRPDPSVATPHWDTFVAAVLPDPEVRAWAMRVLSVGLTGYPDAAVPILYGRERSGKTSLIELIMNVIGTYGHAADAKLLGDVKEHSAIIYDLRGRRLSFIDEGPKRGLDATERLKQLTGGGSMTARPMNANPITFRPTHTLVMTTNNEPAITDPALRARIRLIPCDEPETNVRAGRQALLGGVLEAEAPGILAAIMRDAAVFLADRNTVAQAAAPVSIRSLGEEMAAGQDPVRQWVEECTVPSEPGTPSRQLYTAFAGWHQANPVYKRLSVTSETAFGRTLSDMGHPARKSHGTMIRPLSVLGPTLDDWRGIPRPNPGANYSPPPTPSPAPRSGPAEPAPAQQGPSAPPVGGGLVEGSGRAADVPSPTHNPSTAPVFVPLGEGGEGFIGEVVVEKTHTPLKNLGAIQGPNPLPSPSAPSEPALTSDDGPQEGWGDTPPQGSTTPSPADDLGTGVPEAPVSPRRVSATEAARLADEQGITKAEARKRIASAAKAQKRADAIAAAQGELYELPVVVDREGNTIPVTVEQATAIVRACLGRECGCIDAGPGHLSVDVETSGFPIGHELYELRTVQLGDDVATVVFDPIEQSDTIRMLLTEPRILHAFSATADLIPIAHANLMHIDSGWDRMVDVVIAAKTADPSQAPATADGLKPLAPAVLGPHAVVPSTDAARDTLFHALGAIKQVRSDTPVEKNGWYQVDRRSEVMLRYAASDVLDTHACAKTLPWPAPHVLARERLAQRMVSRISDRGLRIDAEHVARLLPPAEQRHGEASARVRAFGIEKATSNVEIARKLAEMGAPLPRTPKGAPSADKAALGKLAAEEGPVGDLVRAVLDLRHETTLLGLFLRPYEELCRHGDGRARPTIYTLSADTGRMSAVRPNIQQLSREGGVRACLTADPGHLLISADFSGVEIRVAAALSQDPTLLEFLRDGRDLHSEVALQVFGADDEASAEKGRPTPRKTDRYKVKSGVFGRIYGGGVPTLAGQMGVHEGIAQSMVDVLDMMFPQLTAWSTFMRNQVKKGNTQFPSYSGRTIHFPRAFPHKAPNFAIQGTARELLIDTLERWHATSWGECTLFPVHDELVVMVPEDEADAALAELVRCMANQLNGVDIVGEPGKTSFAWADSV